jgi:urease accessory protein
MSRPRATRTRIRTVEPAAAAVVPARTGEAPPLLRLLHLASPALPIGAFHFSQGLEYAVEARWVTDETSALEWIVGVAGAGLATLDLPVLQRLQGAWSHADDGAVLRWNAFLIACRETGELRAEDRHLGAALLRVLAEIGVTTKLFPLNAAKSTVGVAHATAYAMACAQWGIEREAALQTYAWSWAENQVLAAVKLVPLGQSAAQRMLHALCMRIPPWVERSCELADSDVGVSTVLCAVASGRHETQYSRLFRS